MVQRLRYCNTTVCNKCKLMSYTTNHGSMNFVLAVLVIVIAATCVPYRYVANNKAVI
jgi:hypothetical protein